MLVTTRYGKISARAFAHWKCVEVEEATTRWIEALSDPTNKRHNDHGRREDEDVDCGSVGRCCAVPAHADGLPVPLAVPVMAAPLPYTLPYRQGPPTRSCITTAIQLGYQTGNRYVANAAIEACKLYAPVQYPRRDPPPMPLGISLCPTVTTDDKEQRRPAPA